MTRANRSSARHDYASSHTVYLRPGEGLQEARRRWEMSTGRRGLILVR